MLIPTFPRPTVSHLPREVVQRAPCYRDTSRRGSCKPQGSFEAILDPAKPHPLEFPWFIGAYVATKQEINIQSHCSLHLSGTTSSESEKMCRAVTFNRPVFGREQVQPLSSNSMPTQALSELPVLSDTLSLPHGQPLAHTMQNKAPVPAGIEGKLQSTKAHQEGQKTKGPFPHEEDFANPALQKTALWPSPQLWVWGEGRAVRRGGSS